MNYKKSGVLWKLIKQVAPGLNKKCSVKPLPILQLEDGTNATTYEEVRKRWQRHFAEIELGQIATYDSITADIRKSRDGSLAITNLEDVPTRLVTEQFCHNVKVASALGPIGIPPVLLATMSLALSRLLGPLYFKIAATAAEPVTFKESTQSKLYNGKRVQHEAKHSRGITCANVLSKPLNASCRS